jgi:hypothetical protein
MGGDPCLRYERLDAVAAIKIGHLAPYLEKRDPHLSGPLR